MFDAILTTSGQSCTFSSFHTVVIIHLLPFCDNFVDSQENSQLNEKVLFHLIIGYNQDPLFIKIFEWSTCVKKNCILMDMFISGGI